jgi:hypothetical protein
MSNQLQKWQPPTISELTETLEQFAKDDVLNITLSTEPPQRWVKEHPTIKVKVLDQNGQPKSVPLQYIPVDKQRLLAKRLFGIVKVEILNTAQLFNSVCVTVRLHFKHPVTGDALFMDGVGAVGVQTDQGATASDMSKIKFDGVMKAAPAAAAYAEKNAYDKLGRLFGGEIQKDALPFTQNMAMYAEQMYNAPTVDMVSEMYEEKKDSLSPDEQANIERIITNNETASFKKAIKLMDSK